MTKNDGKWTKRPRSPGVSKAQHAALTRRIDRLVEKYRRSTQQLLELTDLVYKLVEIVPVTPADVKKITEYVSNHD